MDANKLDVIIQISAYSIFAPKTETSLRSNSRKWWVGEPTDPANDYNPREGADLAPSFAVGAFAVNNSWREERCFAYLEDQV